METISSFSFSSIFIAILFLFSSGPAFGGETYSDNGRGSETLGHAPAAPAGALEPKEGEDAKATRYRALVIDLRKQISEASRSLTPSDAIMDAMKKTRQDMASLQPDLHNPALARHGTDVVSHYDKIKGALEARRRVNDQLANQQVTVYDDQGRPKSGTLGGLHLGDEVSFDASKGKLKLVSTERIIGIGDMRSDHTAVSKFIFRTQDGQLVALDAHHHVMASAGLQLNLGGSDARKDAGVLGLLQPVSGGSSAGSPIASSALPAASPIRFLRAPEPIPVMPREASPAIPWPGGFISAPVDRGDRQVVHRQVKAPDGSYWIQVDEVL
jgi:hypothetical protein